MSRPCRRCRTQNALREQLPNDAARPTSKRSARPGGIGALTVPRMLPRMSETAKADGEPNEVVPILE